MEARSCSVFIGEPRSRSPFNSLAEQSCTPPSRPPPDQSHLLVGVLSACLHVIVLLLLCLLDYHTTPRDSFLSLLSSCQLVCVEEGELLAAQGLCARVAVADHKSKTRNRVTLTVLSVLGLLTSIWKMMEREQPQSQRHQRAVLRRPRPTQRHLRLLVHLPVHLQSRCHWRFSLRL
jgi:hypothetical protein